MKQKQCQHIKSDSTKCTSFAMSDSDYCYRHNPEILHEEKINASAKGGINNLRKHNCEFDGRNDSPSPSGREGWGLPPLKIENFNDLSAVMADSINRVRSGEISQKTGSTLAYMSFVMYMILDKAKAESKQEKIDKLKAEGKWRPEPKYAPKFYTYKDDFFLDKDGNHLVVEKDGSTFHPRLEFKLEKVECRDSGTKSRPGGNGSTFRPILEFKPEDVECHDSDTKSRPGGNGSTFRPRLEFEREEDSGTQYKHHRRKKKHKPFSSPLNGVPSGSRGVGGFELKTNSSNDEFVKQTVEILNELKEGIEMRKKEEESSP